MVAEYPWAMITPGHFAGWFSGVYNCPLRVAPSEGNSTAWYIAVFLWINVGFIQVLYRQYNRYYGRNPGKWDIDPDYSPIGSSQRFAHPAGYARLIQAVPINLFAWIN